MTEDMFNVYRRLIEEHRLNLEIRLEANKEKKIQLQFDREKARTKLISALDVITNSNSKVTKELFDLIEYESNGWSTSKYIEQPESIFLAYIIPKLEDILQEQDEFEYEGDDND